MTLEIEVYEADNDTLVDVLDAGQFLSARGLKAPLGGAGSIVLPRLVNGVANPALTLIEHQRLIRFTDGDFVWTMEIEGVEDTPLSPDSEAGETVTVTGRDWLSARTDKMHVLPDQGLGVLPWHPTRWFNFSADRLRDDDPDGPQGAWPFGYGQLPNYDTDNYFGRPVGFTDTAGPDGDGPEWVWDADTRTAFADVGVVYFRQRFELEDAAAIQFEFAADDEGELWCDGVPICKSEGVYLGACVKGTVRLSAGEHLLSGIGKNLNGLRAGVVFAGWTVSDAMPDTCVVRSDASLCRVLAYPEDPPGFTPTEVIRLVFDEWYDTFDAVSEIVESFISASDSASVEIDEVVDIAAKAPADTIYTLLRHLQETYLDIAEDPTSLGIDAWIRGTAGSDLSATVILEKGTAGRVTHDERSNERATHAVVSGDNFAPFAVAAPGSSPTDYAVALDFGGASQATAAKFAAAYLAEIANYRAGITVEIVPGLGPSPAAGDFTVFDTIGVLDRDGTIGDHRVVGIGFDLNADSIVRYTIELDQPRAQLEERLAVILRKQTPGAAGGRTVLPTPIDPQFSANEKGSEDVHTWQWDGDLGEVVLKKNGTAITGAVLTVADGNTEKVTLTNAAREYVKEADKLTFTVDGGTPSPEWVPPKGRWIQELRVTADGESITITVSVV